MYETVTPYADLDYADAYFGDRLHSDEWFAKSPADQLKALKMATRDINRLDYADDKVDPDQYDEFPRGTQTEVPNDILVACCEIAFERLVNEVNPDLEIANAKVLSEAYSSVRTTYVPGTPYEHVMAGIASATAWSYLLPYLKDNRSFKLSRVN